MIRKAQTEENRYAETVTHLKLLCSTLEEELGPVIREKKDLISHGVMTFEQIWTLFEPGCLVYHRSKSDEDDRVYRLKAARIATSDSRRVYSLECQYVDFDGTAFGYNKETISIFDFRGTKKITQFEAYVAPGARSVGIARLDETLATRSVPRHLWLSFTDFVPRPLGIRWSFMKTVMS
jgi:hypothetical protein